MSIARRADRLRIQERACELYVDNRTAPLRPDEAAAFMSWLRESRTNVEEYLAVAALAEQLPAVAGEAAESEAALIAAARADDGTVVELGGRPAPRARSDARLRRRLAVRRPTRFTLAAAAALLAAVGALLLWGRETARAPYTARLATAHALQRAWSLPDGSIVRLNSDSRLFVSYSAGERLVTLEQGEALFEVAHDPGRRFRVDAGGAGAIAIGTQFAVYRKPSGTAVITVVEGAIGVFSGGPPAASAGLALPPSAVRVNAGQQVTVPRGAAPSAPVAVDVADATAWLHRRIAFEGRPLGEVVEEFNRFARVPFVVEDEATRELRISGAFSADDAESFADFLAALDGVRLRRDADAVRIVARPPRA